MGWCFAIINSRLAEIYFEKNSEEIKFFGHCYVDENEYKSVEEKKWIKKDTSKTKFSYRNGTYKRVQLTI